MSIPKLPPQRRKDGQRNQRRLSLLLSNPKLYILRMDHPDIDSVLASMARWSARNSIDLEEIDGET